MNATEETVQAAPPVRGFLREHPIKAAAVLLMVAALAIGGFLWWRYSQTYETTDDAQVDGHVNSISTRVSGTVTAVHFTENQTVKQGDLLVELDTADYQIALERAQANLLQEQAQIRADMPSLSITATTSGTEISTSRAGIASAEAGFAAAQQDYQAQLSRIAEAEANNARAQADAQRFATLVGKDEVSREEYDQRVAAAKAAAAVLQTARSSASAAQKVIEQREAAVSQARSSLNQATQNAPQQLAAQRATVDLRRASALGGKAAVEEARLNLSYTKIFAPIAGVIGRKSVEVGQRIQPGQQLASIVPLEDIWVTADFKENQLRRMRVGQSAKIHVDAFDRDFEGYVDSMPPATAGRFSVLPAENSSGNYVKVVQRLPVRLRFKQGQDADRQLRPGMSVVAKVWIK